MKTICYDNGGETMDRYCVVYVGKEFMMNDGCFQGVSMNDAPFHPQGICQHGACSLGRHLGKRIAFKDLPKDCQEVVRRDKNG
jgi:hypothetical protein